MKKILIVFLVALVLIPAYAKAGDSLISVYAASALTGGATGALDAVSVNSLDTGDAAMVSVAGDKVYHYVYNSSSSAAESSPDVIKPDDNGGNGRWILTGVYIPSGIFQPLNSILTDIQDKSTTSAFQFGTLTGSKIVKSGGTSAQFLKADGSVDSTNYVDPAETASSIEDIMTGADAVTTPADADTMSVVVSAVLKKVTWANVKATLKTYFDTLYLPKTQVQICSKTIASPDILQLLQDKWPLLAVESEAFPYGITILDIGIKTDISSTYSISLLEFTAPDDGSPATIESGIATSSSYEAEDDGTLADASVAAGSIVYVDLPTTTVSWLVVWFTYTINGAP